eukprot:3676247-Rhodomonas_salina.2
MRCPSSHCVRCYQVDPQLLPDGGAVRRAASDAEPARTTSGFSNQGGGNGRLFGDASGLDMAELPRDLPFRILPASPLAMTWYYFSRTVLRICYAIARNEIGYTLPGRAARYWYGAMLRVTARASLAHPPLPPHDHAFRPPPPPPPPLPPSSSSSLTQPRSFLLRRR